MMSRTRGTHPLKMLATTVGTALLVWGLILAYASSPAWAATITVNSLADDADGTDGECTLREAITSANTDTASGAAEGECAAGSGDDVIDVEVTGMVNLTAALPDLTSNIDIKGPRADRLTVRRDSGGDYRIFTISIGSVVSISEITISNGNASGPGGGIGGGIYNNGTLTLTGSTVSGNTAQFGGGVYSDTNLFSRTTTITNSTVSGNSATGDGGGIFNFDGVTVIEHSTITDNTATSTSGTGSGVASFGDEFTRTEVLSTIISANTNDEDVESGTTNSFDSNGHNLVGDGNATAAFDQTGDQPNVTDPLLGELADNGGPTMTHALLPNSPATDQGNSSGTTTDQRGLSRPVDFLAIANATGGDGSDIGAFEVQPNRAPAVAVARGGACGASAMRGTIDLSLSDPDDPPEDLTLTATSSDQAVVPDGNIVLGGGTDASRTLTVTAIGDSGDSALTVTVGDPGDLKGTVEVAVVVGTNTRDALAGSDDASDIVFARKGNDAVSGQGENDLLCGGNGKDSLGGGDGDDTMRGGKNDDTLTGGAGADLFGGGSGTDTATDPNEDPGDTQNGIESP